MARRLEVRDNAKHKTQRHATDRPGRWGRIGSWFAAIAFLGLVVAPAQAAPFAYIPLLIDIGFSAVSVIDTATNTVVATTPGFDNWLEGVAVHPAGTFVYLPDLGGNTVLVLDTATNTVVATVPVGSGPLGGVATHPAGTFVYVSGSGTVPVIDTATNTVVATVSVPGGPGGVAVHPAGTFVYAPGSGTVSVIDTATNTEVATVSVGPLLKGVAVHPAGTFVYVTKTGFDHSVSVIDTATNTVVATVPTGNIPNAFGQFVGPTLPGVSLTLNQATFHPGQTLIVRATTYGGAEPRLVDAYVEGRLPDGTIGFLQADGTFTADRRPIASNVSVGPSSGELARHTFDGTHPSGSYRLQGYFTEPGTSSVIGLVAHAAFTVMP